MKTSRTSLALQIVAGLALLAIGFCAGGIYAARRASYAGHTGTLVWLTGIHKALEKQSIGQARKLTAGAVDAHVAVLRQLETMPFACVIYIAPWTGDRDSTMAQSILSNFQGYFHEYQEELRPETLDFLASHAISTPKS